MKQRPIRRSERVLLDGGPQFFRRHAGILLFCFCQQHHKFFTTVPAQSLHPTWHENAGG